MLLKEEKRQPNGCLSSVINEPVKFRVVFTKRMLFALSSLLLVNLVRFLKFVVRNLSQKVVYS